MISPAASRQRPRFDVELFCTEDRGITSEAVALGYDHDQVELTLAEFLAAFRRSA
jgi:hypothetical protein